VRGIQADLSSLFYLQATGQPPAVSDNEGAESSASESANKLVPLHSFSRHAVPQLKTLFAKHQGQEVFWITVRVLRVMECVFLIPSCAHTPCVLVLQPPWDGVLRVQTYHPEDSDTLTIALRVR